jgi:hypothetical protein
MALNIHHRHTSLQIRLQRAASGIRYFGQATIAAKDHLATSGALNEQLLL